MRSVSDAGPTTIRERSLRWILGCLRGELPLAPESSEAILACAGDHGVSPLLCHALRTSGAWQSLPETLASSLCHRAARSAVEDALLTPLVSRAISELARIGIPSLLLKGEALAHRLYPSSHLRARCDTDLWVPDYPEAQAACEALECLGYRRLPTIPGDTITFQQTCVREAFPTHSIDVHWRVHSLAFLARALVFDEAFAQAVAIPQLGAGALSLCNADALLVSCLHRVGHAPQGDANRLIWLYDIHLLASSLGDDEFRLLLERARRCGLGGIVVSGLRAAQSRFGTSVPQERQNALLSGPQILKPDEVDRLSALRLTWTEVTLLPDWSTRLRWARQVCLPEESYMRGRYDRQEGPLAGLYAARILRGARAALGDLQRGRSSR